MYLYKHKKSDWITLGIIRSTKVHDNLYRTLKSTPIRTLEHAHIYINFYTYNKILTAKIRLAKQMYYNQLFEKKLWVKLRIKIISHIILNLTESLQISIQ